MAIYGLNFNGTQIPEAVKRRFAREKRFPSRPTQPKGTIIGRLAGVCNTPEEQSAMAMQAHNGHRTWYWEKRRIAGVTWYGFYET